jgi:hypothetical protein
MMGLHCKEWVSSQQIAFAEMHVEPKYLVSIFGNSQINLTHSKNFLNTLKCLPLRYTKPITAKLLKVVTPKKNINGLFDIMVSQL